MKINPICKNLNFGGLWEVKLKEVRKNVTLPKDDYNAIDKGNTVSFVYAIYRPFSDETITPRDAKNIKRINPGIIRVTEFTNGDFYGHYIIPATKIGKSLKYSSEEFTDRRQKTRYTKTNELEQDLIQKGYGHARKQDMEFLDSYDTKKMIKALEDQ